MNTEANTADDFREETVHPVRPNHPNGAGSVAGAEKISWTGADQIISPNCIDINLFEQYNICIGNITLLQANKLTKKGDAK